MWNDLNMHDRHKLIRLAVTNGVYDLDTIRSLYNNNEYKDGGKLNTYAMGGNPNLDYDPTLVPPTRPDIHNFPTKKDTGKRHYEAALATSNPEAVGVKAYNIAKNAGFTDEQAYEYVYDAVTNANKTLWNPVDDSSKNKNLSTKTQEYISEEYVPPIDNYSPIDHGDFTKEPLNYYETMLTNLETGEQKIARLYRDMKHKYPEIASAIDIGGAFFYPLGIMDAGMAVDNIKNPKVENSYSDYLDLLGFIPTGKVVKTLATKQAAKVTNELADLARRKYISSIKRKRLEKGIQNDATTVKILPYIGLETPNYISDTKDVVDKYNTNFALGGDLPTDPNRPIIDTQPTIDKIRAERLVKYTAPYSELAQIKKLTDNIREKEFKREFAEWINPTRNTNNYVDIRKTIPIAEARPTFINTYEKGGPKDPPYDWTKAWTDAQSVSNETKPTGHYNVVATDGKNPNYENNVTPDLSWYKDPLENTRMVTEEPIEPLYGFKDPVFNVALLGAGLANGIGNVALGSATKATMEGLSKPIATIASQIPQLGKYSYMLPTLDKALWTATGASGLYNRVSDEGIQGITSHPFLTAMDLGMLSPVGKGIKSSVSKSMSGLLDRTAEAMVRQGDLLQNPKKWNKKGMLNYILRGRKHPELAYKSGPYSGEYVTIGDYFSHPKDVVDAFFNKGYTMRPSNIEMEPHLKQYINKNYPNKNIKIYDLGDIKDSNIMGSEISNEFNTVDVGGYNAYPINSTKEGKTYLSQGWDIWKFNGNDLLKSHGYDKKHPIIGRFAKHVGNFIDSRGTPLVHTWKTYVEPYDMMIPESENKLPSWESEIIL